MPVKRRKRKNLKDKSDRLRDSKLATVAMGVVLLNVFQWAYFLRTEMLVSTGLSTILSGIGLAIAISAKKRIRRYMGVIQGESRAQLAYYVHLIVGILSLFLFSWLVLMGILRGDFI